MPKQVQRKLLQLLTLLLAFTLIAAACGDDDDSEEPEATPTTEAAPEEEPEDMPEDEPEDMPEDEPEAAPEDEPEDMPEEEPEDMPEDEPEPVETRPVIAAFDSDGDGTVTIGVAAAGPRDDNGYYQSLVNFAEQFSADNGFAPPIVSDNIGAAEAAQALSDLAQQGVDILMVGASEIAEPLPDLTAQYPRHLLVLQLRRRIPGVARFGASNRLGVAHPLHGRCCHGRHTASPRRRQSRVPRLLRHQL